MIYSIQNLKENVDNIVNLSSLSLEDLNNLMNEMRVTLNYNFKTSNLNYEWFLKLNKEERLEKLGQVFTPTLVGQLITDLCIDKEDSLIFDPCFGNAVFLISAYKRLRSITN